MPEAEVIADTSTTAEWLTETLKGGYNQPLRDGHARILSIAVHLELPLGKIGDDLAMACPLDAVVDEATNVASFVPSEGRLKGFELPCDEIGSNTDSIFDVAEANRLNFSSDALLFSTKIRTVSILIYHGGALLPQLLCSALLSVRTVTHAAGGAGQASALATPILIHRSCRPQWY